MQSKGVALVTGGARRIGRAMCTGLAKAGYDIALHFNTSHRESESARSEIRRLGRKCELFRHDLSNMKEVASLIESVFKVFPSCSILINNAAIFEAGRFLDTNEALFDRHFKVNFKAQFFLTRDFALRCKGNGIVINMLDSYISKQMNQYFAYILTKKLLHSFTEMAAKELGPRIRVNGICPGVVLPSELESKATINRIASRTPLRKKVKLDDIIETLLYLIRSDKLTGETIFVDSGAHLT